MKHMLPLLTALLMTFAVQARGSTAAVFYVSTSGSDQWSGKLPAPAADCQDGPFATLTAARNAVRGLKAAGNPPDGMEVRVLEGTYHLVEPLVLTSEDGGIEKCPVTYMAYPGHHPVLSGGRVIGDWKPFSGRILRSHLPDVQAGRWKFRQLFFRGQRQIRARWPNQDPADPLYGGWAFIESVPSTDAGANKARATTFRYAADQSPRRWSKLEQAEVHVFPWYCWVNDLLPLQSADFAGRSLTLTEPPHFEFMTLVPGNRFCVENVLEELDQPGEWCLCTDSGDLYFWPPDDLKPGDVIAPVTDTLIELRGSADAPVQHLTISRLTFSHTLSPFPDHLHPNFHSPTMRGAGVSLEHCVGVRIEGNRFALLGGDGVRLQGANAENVIFGNEISEAGGAGVVLVSHDKTGNSGDTKDFADPTLLRGHSCRYPKLVRNVISDNDIHHCGRLKKNCGGVHFYGINSVENVISHNRIHHLSDKGMTMQDGFGRFIVEYNDMDQVGLEIADTGGIMINRWFYLPDDPELAEGSLIRFNRIRNCIGCGAYTEKRHPKGEGDRTTAGGRIWTPYYTWGIYLDNSGMNTTVYGNIIASTVLGAVAMPVGAPQNNRVENNLFIGSSGNQFDLRMQGQDNRFTRNIVFYTDPQAMLLAAGKTTKEAVAECDHNLYFLAADREPEIRGIGSLGDWRKLGFDQHSLVADPLFVDAKNGDYRLRPESPAFRLGFRPIPVDQIGPRLKKRQHDAR